LRRVGVGSLLGRPVAGFAIGISLTSDLGARPICGACGFAVRCRDDHISDVVGGLRPRMLAAEREVQAVVVSPRSGSQGYVIP
jgi:hypothetical protein